MHWPDFPSDGRNSRRKAFSKAALPVAGGRSDPSCLCPGGMSAAERGPLRDERRDFLWVDWTTCGSEVMKHDFSVVERPIAKEVQDTGRRKESGNREAKRKKQSWRTEGEAWGGDRSDPVEGSNEDMFKYQQE